MLNRFFHPLLFWASPILHGTPAGRASGKDSAGQGGIQICSQVASRSSKGGAGDVDKALPSDAI